FARHLVWSFLAFSAVDSDGHLRSCLGLGMVDEGRRTRSYDRLAGPETKWKGSRAREGNGYKLSYSGSSNARNGVGIILAGRLKDNVVRVTRGSDRIMAILVVIEGETTKERPKTYYRCHTPRRGKEGALGRLGRACEGMSGPGKGALKGLVFRVQASKLSKSQHMSHPHKLVRENDIQLEDVEIQEEVQTESGDVPQPCTSVTRKETRALNEAKKRRMDKGKLVFEIDESVGRITGQDSQCFITKGGCLVHEYGMFDGTTWKQHPDLLKTDIISKCVENSTFDGKCKRSVDAIDSQLGNQHKNQQHRLHVIYNKFPTHEEALVDPPSSIKLSDWVKLCDKFSSEMFQKRREGKNMTAIDSYEIAHYCEKKKKMVSEEAVAVLVCSATMAIIESEKNKSAALEEKLKEVTVEQDEMKKCMGLMMKEIQRLSKLVPDKSS
nr:myb domain protein 62 [Tanacetum cinerariifolium]